MSDLLTQARAAGVDRLDAQLLLGRVLQQPRAWLIAHDDHPLDTAQAQDFLSQVAERARGIPLAYLLGEREFRGLMLRVTPDVLVPRPDTETLVDWALELLASRDRTVPADGRTTPPMVADLGTGSGAIALALKHARPTALVCAVERSPAALAVAHANGLRLGLPVEWLQGDWFTPLAGRRFDLIVSNPPYIDGADAHLAALHAEPIAALTPGPDGLADLRVLARNAPHHLQPGGWLLLEHGHDQGAAVRSLLQAEGLERVQTRCDLGGQERCTAGRRGPA
ncbi:MAG: peptide chain release factor N(5)-glutamine methyltransferase [Betaproteobacteria bacterium]